MFFVFQVEEPTDITPPSFPYIIQTTNPYTPPDPQALATMIEPELEIDWGYNGCSCINYIKLYYVRFTSVSLYSPWHLWNNFETYGLEKTEPEIGALIITKDHPYWWHIGIISSVSEERVKITEKNIVPCEITTRKLDRDSDIIVGYLK